MITYTVITFNGEMQSLTRSDGVCIPFDPANTDAQQFAKWLQEGNKPEPAEEDGVVTDEWVAEIIAKLLPAEETK